MNNPIKNTTSQKIELCEAEHDPATYLNKNWKHSTCVDIKEYGVALESVYKKSNDNIRMFSNTISLISSGVFTIQFYIVGVKIGLVKNADPSIPACIISAIILSLSLFLYHFIQKIGNLSIKDRSIILKIDEKRMLFDSEIGIYDEKYKNYDKTPFCDSISEIWNNLNKKLPAALILFIYILPYADSAKNANSISQPSAYDIFFLTIMAIIAAIHYLISDYRSNNSTM